MHSSGGGPYFSIITFSHSSLVFALASIHSFGANFSNISVSFFSINSFIVFSNKGLRKSGIPSGAVGGPNCSSSLQACISCWNSHLIAKEVAFSHFCLSATTGILLQSHSLGSFMHVVNCFIISSPIFSCISFCFSFISSFNQEGAFSGLHFSSFSNNVGSCSANSSQ